MIVRSKMILLLQFLIRLSFYVLFFFFSFSYFIVLLISVSSTDFAFSQRPGHDLLFIYFF